MSNEWRHKQNYILTEMKNALNDETRTEKKKMFTGILNKSQNKSFGSIIKRVDYVYKEEKSRWAYPFSVTKTDDREGCRK